MKPFALVGGLWRRAVIGWLASAGMAFLCCTAWAGGGGNAGGGGSAGGGGGMHGAAPPLQSSNSVAAVPSGVAPLNGGAIPGAFPRGVPTGRSQGSSTTPPIFVDPYWSYWLPYYEEPLPMPYVDPNGYAYFCPALNAYYPDTQACPGPWLAVLWP